MRSSHHIVLLPCEACQRPDNRIQDYSDHDLRGSRPSRPASARRLGVHQVPKEICNALGEQRANSLARRLSSLQIDAL